MAQLAEAAGWSTRSGVVTLSRYENAHQVPNSERVMELARALGVGADALIGGANTIAAPAPPPPPTSAATVADVLRAVAAALDAGVSPAQAVGVLRALAAPQLEQRAPAPTPPVAAPTPPAPLAAAPAPATPRTDTAPRRTPSEPRGKPRPYDLPAKGGARPKPGHGPSGRGVRGRGSGEDA